MNSRIADSTIMSPRLTLRPMACGCPNAEESGKKRVRIGRAKLARRVYIVHLTEVGQVADVTTESLSEARELASKYGTPAEEWAPPAAAEPAAYEGPGRIAGDDMMGEPLLAIAEGDTNVVGCCGGCEEPKEACVPRTIRVERVKRTAEGFAFETREKEEFDLPKKLVKVYEQKSSHQCLPWVRIARDPKRFRQCLQRARDIGAIDNPKKIAQLVQEHLATEDQEVFLVVLLDSQMQVRGITELARGARDRVAIPIPDVLRLPLIEGATAFIVVHNHPSGRTDPSEADKLVTEAIAKAGKTVGVPLLDHVIVGADSIYSFNSHGLV
jgi:DNA repair protein RadC